MTDFRREGDLLGEREIPASALHGIHTLRALENGPVAGRRVHPALIHAYGAVKLAAARTNRELGCLAEEKAGAIEAAADELRRGLLDEAIPVDALGGGAGTSLNMCVSEVLANRALELLGRTRGDYAAIHPLDDVNLHQSTNDTFPTALRVAAIGLLRKLEEALVALQEAFQDRERAFARVVKVGRTEYQDAVLTTLGREMGAYAEAFGRDRWRVHKCEERLRVVNLGGTAIGTGLGAPREYIFRVVEHLRAITGLGLARAENLVDATQNQDALVEVSGIIKASAANLVKVASDLRLLGSGPDAGLGELRLPARQAGSTIMPGKVNPVIPEAVTQAALMVMGNDGVVTTACALGSLELNALLPLIADRLLDSLDLLTRAADLLARLCVRGLEADLGRCRAHVDAATATLTALVGAVPYSRLTEAAAQARATGRPVREVVLALGLLGPEELEALLKPEAVLRLGAPSTRDP